MLVSIVLQKDADVSPIAHIKLIHDPTRNKYA